MITMQSKDPLDVYSQEKLYKLESYEDDARDPKGVLMPLRYWIKGLVKKKFEKTIG